MTRAIRWFVVAILTAVSVVQAQTAAPNATFSITLDKALPTGTLTLVATTIDGRFASARLVQADGTTAWPDPAGLVLEGAKMRGEIKAALPGKQATSVALTLEAAIAGEAVTGKFNGTVGAATVNGALTGKLGAKPGYPCWRADGSGTGPECGQPLVIDITKARWVWESEEKRMSSSYGYLQGGIGAMAVADGKVFHSYAYPGGEPDKDLQAKFLAFFQRAEKTGGKNGIARLKATLGTTDYTTEEYAELLSRPKMADHIVCIAAATGKTLWKQAYLTDLPNKNGRPEGRRGLAPEGVSNWSPYTKPKQGPHNTPSIAYGKVAVVGNSGTLYCFDATTGKLAWQTPVASGPRVNVSVLYGNGYFVCPVDKKGMVAFDAATGEEKWIYAPRYVPTGAQGPVRFVHGGKELMLYGPECVDLTDGKVLWKIDGAAVSEGSPCVGEGYIVFTGGKKLTAGLNAYKLDADPTKVPEKAWALDVQYSGVNNCTPVIYKSHVYAKTQGELTMFTTVDLATGTQVQQIRMHTDAHASTVAGDGVIFYEGHHFTAAPHFKELPGIAEFFSAGDECELYANSHTPPYVEGRLFIKGNNSIRCLDLRAE
jgi:outer membrane protein assembly factor BamB